MICINCNHTKTSVTNSRPQDNGLRTWRRRQCQSCNDTFTTNETVDDKEVSIHTSSGASSPFDTGRLTTSIFSSFAHDQQKGASSSYWIAMSVKYMAISRFKSQQLTLTSRDISTLTYEALDRFDDIAAVQYAARNNLMRSSGRPTP